LRQKETMIYKIRKAVAQGNHKIRNAFTQIIKLERRFRKSIDD